MKLSLTKEDILDLEVRDKTERDKRVADRIKAILLSNEGWKQQDIAKVLLISTDSISRHIAQYLSERKLQPSNGGSASKLNSEQTVQLISHLEDKMYVNTAEIVSYISSTYGVSYTEKGIYDWLIAHHFTYKKSTGLPAKADSDQQTAHIETYKRLVTTLPKDEVIVFMDSAHPTQATELSYGWIRKGRDKTVPTVAGRKRINLTGAINLVDQGLLVHSYDAINGDTIS